MEKEAEIEIETEIDEISNLQNDVNVCRKYGIRAEGKYLKLAINKKMQQVKSIVDRSHDINLPEADKIKNPSMNSTSAELTQISQNLNEKKQKVLQDARNVFAILQMTNSERYKNDLQRRKYFENIVSL